MLSYTWHFGSTNEIDVSGSPSNKETSLKVISSDYKLFLRFLQIVNKYQRIISGSDGDKITVEISERSGNAIYAAIPTIKVYTLFANEENEKVFTMCVKSASRQLKVKLDFSRLVELPD